MRGRAIRVLKTEPAEGVKVEMGSTARIRSIRDNTPLSSNHTDGNNTYACVQVDNANLPRAVRPGDDVSFDDGKLNAVILETAEDGVKIQFKNSGWLRPGVTMNIPGKRLS